MASNTPAMRSRYRVMALSPPAVFSMRTGTFRSVASMALRQLSNPMAGSSPGSRWPPWTMSPLAPISAAPSTCFCSSFRDGMRMRLFVVATLTR
jgi:hypothetical protein